jgi:molecular chaperone GrpE (heat shock protein)
MLNNHRNATKVFVGRKHIEAPETRISARPANARSSGGEERQPTSEGVAGAVELDVALAYQALLDDNEAFRTRLERENGLLLQAEKATVAQALLDATDDLERALAATNASTTTDQGYRHLAQGVRLSLEVLYKKIADMGAERISTIG